jgi:hypothetical protein
VTTWTNGTPELWKAALAASTPQTRAANRRRLFRIAGTTTAAAALILAAVGVLFSTMNDAHVRTGKDVGFIAFDSGFAAPVASTNRSSMKAPDNVFVNESDSADHAFSADRVGSSVAEKQATERSRESDALRQVIRKATIELLVPNTRETFAKCQHLLRADLSEFVEGSSLTGQDKDARAQLTLRISSTGGRIDEVLNQLRTLGKVESENATGDDVTAQSVDLDASLRNERSVETEILRLLESRKDAKLQDILELREKLAAVRLGIERLQGRRDTLSRQVALASILVIIRADDAPKKDPPKPASIFDRFTDETSTALDRGLLALTQTIAFLIRIAIGGLLWWLLLFAAIAIARRAIRRLIPDPARVPTL